MISSPRTSVDSRHARRSFVAASGSVRQAREFAFDTLAAWGLPARSDDVRLCVSELVTNAFQHGSRPGDKLLVTITAGDLVRLEVHDSCHIQPEVQDPTESDTEGRGLRLVEELSDDWGVEVRGPCKVVWAQFRSEATPSR